MKRPNALSLVLFGFSLGILATANAGTLGSSVFPDVPGGAYFDSAVGDMFAAGIITGYGDGRFGPNDYVTRGQVAVMMQRLKAHLTGQSITVSSSSRSPRTTQETTSSAAATTENVPDVTANNAGSFRFTTGSFKVDEDRGTATINVIRYGGNAGTVTVRYSVEDGTANAGSDYDSTEGTLTFADGKTSGSFQITISDDNEAEQNETVTVKLESPTGGATLGGPVQATLTIIDNDEGDGTSVDPTNAKGVFAFSAKEYHMSEAIDTVTITVERAGTSGEASVKFDTSNGTADSEYYEKQSGTLTFGDGESSRTFTVTIKDNTKTNGNKTVNLKLSNPTGGATLGSLSTATLVVVDNEVSDFGNGTFQLERETYNTQEGSTLVVAIKRMRGAKGDVAVDYEATSTLAKAGDDFTATSGTLTFKDGEAIKLITVPILTDDKDDPRETFKVKISNATGGASIDAPSSATVTIE